MRLRSYKNLSLGRGTRKSGGPVMPALANLSYWFRPETIAQADNTNVASWTDSVASLPISQATTGLQPRYRTAGINGRPALEFNGAAGQYLDMGRPAGMLSIFDQGATTTGYTMFFVLNIAASPNDNFRCYFSPANVNDGNRTLMASAGYFGSRGGPKQYVNASGFHVVVLTVDSVCGAYLHQDFNAWNYTPGGFGSVGAGNYALGGDGTGSTSWSFTGHIGDVGIYNRVLSNAEIARLYKFLCAKYGQSVPWQGRTRFVMFDGDSITQGEGATATAGRGRAQNAWPQLVADAKSIPEGGWSNMAISGITSNTMTSQVARRYAGLSAELGIPIRLFAMEFYNQPDSNANGFLSFCTAVKTADPTIKIAALDSTDNGNTSGFTFSNRASFNAAISAASSSIRDVYVPLSTDTTIGVEGACPNVPGPFGPNFSDNIHPANPGYTAIGSFVGPYYDTLIAL